MSDDKAQATYDWLVAMGSCSVVFAHAAKTTTTDDSTTEDEDD